MDDFRDIVERVRDAADLVEVIESTGPEYSMDHRRRGKYITGNKHTSLTVDVNRQTYTWFASKAHIKPGQQFETGDVYDWMQNYQHLDFWQAVVELAHRYNVLIPERLTKNEERTKTQVKQGESRAKLLLIAHEWFMAQLWNTPAALAYARGRGFSDETIKFKDFERNPQGVDVLKSRGAGLGFSPGTETARKDLVSTLQMYEIDIKSPEAVALVGLQGGVKAWAMERMIDLKESSNWIEDDRIFGLVDRPRLIYTHIWRDKPAYFTGRNLKWEGKKLIGEPDKKFKAYNPPVLLLGERQRYYNFKFHRHAKRVIIVEGQADADSWGEWGEAAVALVGVAADEKLAESIKQIPEKYMALDDDKAGQEALVPVGMVRTERD
jgi:DNA primase